MYLINLLIGQACMSIKHELLWRSDQSDRICKKKKKKKFVYHKMLSDTEDFVSVWGVINVLCWCSLQCNGILSYFCIFIIPLNVGMYLFIHLFLCISSWGFWVVGWAKIVHMLKFCFSYVCWQKLMPMKGLTKVKGLLSSPLLKKKVYVRESGPLRQISRHTISIIAPF